MKTLFAIFSLLLSFTTLAGRPKGVNWFKGSVEEAFKLAKKESRPMFLYWGAVWCPPCNQIKKTIFTKKVFHKESENYINIYLDGDTDAAQKWGDHFGTVGYPTMMILDPMGNEISRMPTGLTVKQYVSLMTKIRGNLIPIDQLVQKAIAGKANLEEYERLAGYSWGQDHKMQETLLSKDNKKSTFEKLYINAPVKPEHIRTHFFLIHIDSKADADEKYQATKKEGELFNKILSDSKYQKGNLELIFFYPKTWKNVFGKTLGEENFKKSYLSLMEKLRNDNSLTWDERLSTLYPLVVLNTKDKEVAAPTQKLVKQWAEKVDKNAIGKYERQASISTAVWLLKTSGQKELAKAMAKRELKKSVSPFYFMSYLGSIEADSGKNKEALEWYKKAWDSSTGRATRFQWGTSYVQNLVKLSPKDSTTIIGTTKDLLAELVQNSDAFYGRNTKRLERLAKSFGEWKKGNDKDFQKLRSEVRRSCLKTSNKEVQKSCTVWVSKL